VYDKIPLFPVDIRMAYMPGKEDGKWDYHGYSWRKLNRDKFDEFKTRFYNLQGWDESSGYPKRKTLEFLGLGYVADELERNSKIGK
jgi:aldehyde:ferredoxin oxidoreductase